MNLLYLRARDLSIKTKKLYKKIRKALGLNIKQISKTTRTSYYFPGIVKRDEKNNFWIESEDRLKAIYFVDNIELKKVKTDLEVSVYYAENHHELKNLDTSVIRYETRVKGSISDKEGFHIATLDGIEANEIRDIKGDINDRP